MSNDGFESGEEEMSVEEFDNEPDNNPANRNRKQLLQQASSVDIDEPTEEEIQDEKEDQAARPIQAMARGFLGKRHACEYGKQVFIKEWDSTRSAFVYVDTRRSPPQRQWTKPRWLGIEDLPEERVYKSPPGYPERKQTQRQFAFVCHTAKFDDPNVPNLPSSVGVKIEHEELKERMQNPYTANFLPADTQFLWEPNKALFLKNLESLKIKCITHIDAEAKSLKYRLEKNFVDTLHRLYSCEDDIPAWEEASNFNSKLLDEVSWRRFDKHRIAMAVCRVHTSNEVRNGNGMSVLSSHHGVGGGIGGGVGSSIRGGPGGGLQRRASKLASSTRPSTGRTTPQNGLAAALKRDANGGNIFNEKPSPIDLHDAMKVREKIFNEWRDDLLAARKKRADAAERIRREKLLVHLRAKNPGRVIEEWELDQVEDDDQDKDVVREVGDSHETRVLKAQALDAMKRINRNRLALAAQKEEQDTGMLDIYKALGADFSALRDCNPSADRLLSLIDPNGAVAQQTIVALILQRRYRGWKGRQKFTQTKTNWINEAGNRELAALAKANAKREAEEEENRRKRRLLGIDPLDQPEEYPWDSRFPCACQRDVGIRDASVTIYIKSHVGHLKGRSKQAGSYLLFRDSNWRSSAGIQRTCLHINELAEFVKSLPFRQRLIILDVVHYPYPTDDSFFKSRVLYPPADMYSELALKSEAVVMGSCRIGSTLNDQIALPQSSPFDKTISNKIFPDNEYSSHNDLRHDNDNDEDDDDTTHDGSVTTHSTAMSSYSLSSTTRHKKEGSSGGFFHSHPAPNNTPSDLYSVMHNKPSAGLLSSTGWADKKGKVPKQTAGGIGIAASMEELGQSTHKIKPLAKLVKSNWKFDNKTRDARNGFCENSVVHLRLPPPSYAEYASLQERNARDLAQKNARELEAMTKQTKVKPTVAYTLKDDDDEFFEENEDDENNDDKRERRNEKNEKRKTQPQEENQLDDDSSLGIGSVNTLNTVDEVWDKKVSIFGEAMLDALSGEAADPDSSDLLQSNQNGMIISPTQLFGAGMIRIESLYQYLATRVYESSKKVRQEEEVELAKRLEGEKEKLMADAEELGESGLIKALAKWNKQEAKRQQDNPPRPPQHVMLWSYHALQSESLCCFPTPTPPPSCTVPKAMSVKYRHIDIAWEVPDYDGEPVLYFEVQRRELTRLTNQWTPTCVYVDAQGKPIQVKKTKLRIPHLAPGVEIQFRVRGRNHGGWGPFSDESDFFMAGADQQPHSVTEMLGRMVMFGANQLLQYMSERDNQPRLPVQQLGLLQLSSLGRDMKKGGTGAALLRPAIAKLAVAASLRAMRNFPWDRPVQQRACLLLRRLLEVHGAWLCEICRKDEVRRLKRVERNLRAQQELDTIEIDEDDVNKEKTDLVIF